MSDTPLAVLAKASFRYQKALAWRGLDGADLGDLATAIGITHGEFRLGIIPTKRALDSYCKILATAYIEGHKSGFEEASRLQGLTVPEPKDETSRCFCGAMLDARGICSIHPTQEAS